MPKREKFEKEENNYYRHDRYAMPTLPWDRSVFLS
jgi:hypothetical protein